MKKSKILICIIFIILLVGLIFSIYYNVKTNNNYTDVSKQIYEEIKHRGDKDIYMGTIVAIKEKTHVPNDQYDTTNDVDITIKGIDFNENGYKSEFTIHTYTDRYAWHNGKSINVLDLKAGQKIAIVAPTNSEGENIESMTIIDD